MRDGFEACLNISHRKNRNLHFYRSRTIIKGVGTEKLSELSSRLRELAEADQRDAAEQCARAQEDETRGAASCQRSLDLIERSKAVVQRTRELLKSNTALD